MSSANRPRPPQHLLFPILTPYLSQLFKTSLMNKLNKIGDNGATLSYTTLNSEFIRQHI